MGLLEPGETCWRIERAGRVAFLIDTLAYFDAVREALARARRSVTILGWGFDPERGCSRMGPRSPTSRTRSAMS